MQSIGYGIITWILANILSAIFIGASGITIDQLKKDKRYIKAARVFALLSALAVIMITWE